MSRKSLRLIYAIYSFSFRRRFKYIILVGTLIIISSLLEALNIITLIPVVNLFTENEIPTSYLNTINYFIEISKYNQNNLLIICSIIFSIVSLLTGLFRLLNLYHNARLAAFIGNDLSSEIYKKVFSQNYYYYKGLENSQVISTITAETELTVRSILSLFSFLTSITLCISIFFTLSAINFKLLLVTSTILITIYLLITFFFAKKLKRNSFSISNSRKRLVEITQQSILNIKDILINRNLNFFLNSFYKEDLNLRVKLSENQFLSGFPRFLLEPSILILVIIISLFSTILFGNAKGLFTDFAIFIFAIQRLIPNMQQCYSCVSMFLNNLGPLTNVFNYLKLDLNPYYLLKNKYSGYEKFELEVKNVFFKYEDSDKFILKDINLKITNGEKIGLLGPSGSGKSTLSDLILGLLNPTMGEILVNGKAHSGSPNRLARWHSTCSHVPQKPFLLEADFYTNIAFKFIKDKSEKKRVEKVSKAAEIDNFINNLPQGYETVIRNPNQFLSGGQIQRIAIARALFRETNLIVLDEPTSSLDNFSQSKIIDYLFSLPSKYALLIISHRLESLKGCTKVYKLEKNKIINVNL